MDEVAMGETISLKEEDAAVVPAMAAFCYVDAGDDEILQRPKN
jgi:hypothetical protein